MGGAATSFSRFDDDGEEIGKLCRGASSLEIRLQAQGHAKGGAEGVWSSFSVSLSVRLGASDPPSHATAPSLVGAEQPLKPVVVEVPDV